MADAVSPANSPLLMFAGGQNNGASSGVLKSIDGGRHWTIASAGMFVTKVEALHIVDYDGASQHLLCAVPGGVYESFDQAGSWSLVPGSDKFGTCNTFKNGTIGGVAHVLAGCSAGIANVPKAGGEWQIIPPGGLSRGYFSVSDSNPQNSIVGICMRILWIGTIVNRTAADWVQYPTRPCTMLALDPNDGTHFIYTQPPLIWRCSLSSNLTQSCDNLGGNGGVFHAGIDRQGWFYTAGMGGAFGSMDRGHTWQRYVSFRTQRRTNRTVMRNTHDYQRVALDFGGGVAFPSDQGLFVKPPGNGTTFIVANGNVSNNIAMAAAVSVGEGVNQRYIVTTAWDWGPLASWDSGAHWPSWQTKEDGYSAGCIGEGGGAYGMGASNRTLIMHHHNVLYSSAGGKQNKRFVTPHGSGVFGPSYARKPGSRTEPSGAVFAPLFMPPLPWDELPDKVVGCQGDDLGEHTNYSCLAHVDIGVAYGWYKGVDYAVWRGDDDRHCHMCRLGGNASTWNFTEAKGAFSYALKVKESEEDRARFLRRFDLDRDGRIDAHDLQEGMARSPKDEDDDDDDDDDDDEDEDDVDDDEDPLAPGSGEGGVTLTYVLKNFNFGDPDSGVKNWTYTPLPPHLQGKVTGFQTSPTDGGKVLYGIASRLDLKNGIPCSEDNGDTWTSCWAGKAGLTGSIRDLVIKDESTIIVCRGGDVPVRTQDGGETWHAMQSLVGIAPFIHSLAYSWTGKTLALAGAGGVQSAHHPHAMYIWRSVDDGDTWTDETADLVTAGAGISQWYETKLYLSSAGQGILAKEFE